MDEVVYIPKIGVKINVLLLILFSLEEFSLLPELHGVVQGEALLNFLDIFGGTTIKVPSRKRFLRSIQDVEIWNRLEQMNENPDDLANEYDLSVETILRRSKKINQIVHNYERVIVKLMDNGEAKGQRRRQSSH